MREGWCLLDALLADMMRSLLLTPFVRVKANRVANQEWQIMSGDHLYARSCLRRTATIGM